MPLLALPQSLVDVRTTTSLDNSKYGGVRPGFIGQCTNPDCDSGWLHLFRKRSRPIFEGGWTCSPECTEARVQIAVRRELEGRVLADTVHRHRIPLGLLMLEKGWITQRQLREALDAQRAAGRGRVGEWLVKLGATDEKTVTRALCVQWSCPTLSIEDGAPALTSLIPRLLVEAYDAVPLRVAAGKLAYLGFLERPDSVLAWAIERMAGLRVECAIVPSSQFGPLLAKTLRGRFPPLELAEAVSEVAASHLLARAIERAQPRGSRIVRVHNCLWLRMFLSKEGHPTADIASVRDVVCTIGDLRFKNTG